jgi:hypothetical protein
MSDTDNKLSELLNTDFIPVVQENKPVTVYQEEDSSKKVDADFSRSTYYGLIERGNEAINGILNVARESQHPRAYEVAATLIKNMSEVTEKLMVLQKQRKELDAEEKPTNVTIDKAVFVGSTADLLKKVKNESNLEG